jgi:hydroxymethylglutaryl-CoA reductase (NADPH)
MKVPAFLLRRLYVKGSLRNVDGGFEFDLKNTLGSGYAERALPLLVGDAEMPLQATSFVVDDVTTPFEAVSPEHPMTLGLNCTVTVAVTGGPLPEGKHTLSIGFVVVGMGEMRFDVTDAIDERADGHDAA